MLEHISDTWRIARKEHRCNYCNGIIRTGERYELSINKFDGDIYEWRSHEKCSFIAGEIWDYADPDEGMDRDCFNEACHDVCSTFVCPNCEKEDTDCCDESYCLDKLYDLFQTKELYRDHLGSYGYSSCWKLRERTAKKGGEAG